MFSLTAYSKMQKTRNALKKELLNKKNQKLRTWELLSLSILQKVRKLILKRTLRVMTEQLCDKKFVVLYLTAGVEMGQNKG